MNTGCSSPAFGDAVERQVRSTLSIGPRCRRERDDGNHRGVAGGDRDQLVARLRTRSPAPARSGGDRDRARQHPASRTRGCARARRWVRRRRRATARRMNQRCSHRATRAIHRLGDHARRLALADRFRREESLQPGQRGEYGQHALTKSKSRSSHHLHLPRGLAQRVRSVRAAGAQFRVGTTDAQIRAMLIPPVSRYMTMHPHAIGPHEKLSSGRGD